MVRNASDVPHFLVTQPFSKLARGLAETVVLEQSARRHINRNSQWSGHPGPAIRKRLRCIRCGSNSGTVQLALPEWLGQTG